MLIVEIDRCRQQASSTIDFRGVVCPDDLCEDVYIDLTPAQCIPKDCQPSACEMAEDDFCMGNCMPFECPPCDAEPVPPTPVRTLRYRCSNKDGTKITVEWCNLIWDDTIKHYDAVLYISNKPCGRFRIQVTCNTPYANSKKEDCRNGEQIM